MSSTRYADENSPPRSERFMSNPAFAELRGQSGTCVAPRAALLRNSEQSELLWWLQQSSLSEVAAGLLSMRPDRAQQPRRIQHTVSAQAARLRALAGEYEREDRAAATVSNRKFSPEEMQHSIRSFLEELCVNPAIRLEDKPSDETPGGAESRYAYCPVFRDIIKSLFEYKEHLEHVAKANFLHTENSLAMWETFEFARVHGTMVLIDGLEGRGKSEATEAYVRSRPGLARAVTISGVNSKTESFRKIAKALGIAHSEKVKSCEMQTRIEEVLRLSKLLLIIDEAHHLFPRATRVYSRPELIDWVWTLNNHGVAVALVTTPQFMKCVEQSAIDVGWNWKQFEGRVARYVQLQRDTALDDLKRIAQRLLSNVSAAGINRAVAYTLSSQLDLRGLGRLVREARDIAEKSKRAVPVSEDIDRAIAQLKGTDCSFAAVNQRIDAGRAKKPKRRSIVVMKPAARGVATAAPSGAPRGITPEAIAPGLLSRNEAPAIVGPIIPAYAEHA